VCDITEDLFLKMQKNGSYFTYYVMSGQNHLSFLQTLLSSYSFENCKWCVLPKSSRCNFYI